MVSSDTAPPVRSGADEAEPGDLGADVEPHPELVAEPTVDVQPPAVAEVELAGRVPLVRHWDERRRQERRLALPAMSVPGENPPAVAAPDVEVGPVRVVAQDD